MSGDIEDPDKTAWTEPTPSQADLAVGDALVQSEQRDQDRVDETGLDESEKDDEVGAPTADLPPREPGVNRRYGEPGETGAAAFQRQHREATGKEPPEPV